MNRHRVTAGLARFWTAGSATLLLVIAIGILTQPDFPLGLGLIRTTGLAGLWVTLVPAVVGLVGVGLVRGSGRLVPGLVFLNSACTTFIRRGEA